MKNKLILIIFLLQACGDSNNILYDNNAKAIAEIHKMKPPIRCIEDGLVERSFTLIDSIGRIYYTGPVTINLPKILNFKHENKNTDQLDGTPCDSNTQGIKITGAEGAVIWNNTAYFIYHAGRWCECDTCAAKK